MMTFLKRCLQLEPRTRDNRNAGKASIYLLVLLLLYTLSASLAKDLPKLFLLGTMKSGSSSLFGFLKKHPHICAGVRKEINFIQDDYHFRHKPQYHVHHGVRSKYADLFRDDRCGTKDMFLDASPQFHLMSKVLPRFRQIYTPEEMAKLKFIVVLREPVARAVSYYEMFTMIALAEGKKLKDIQTQQERDKHFSPYFNDAESLTLFQKYFRRDQIIVFNADVLFKQSAQVMLAIASFLNISYIPAWDGKFPHDDHLSHQRYSGILNCCQTYVPDLDCSFRDVLIDRYSPMNTQLYEILNQTRALAFAEEPIFPRFNDTKVRAMNCVPDTRAAFNIKINQTKVEKCTKH